MSNPAVPRVPQRFSLNAKPPLKTYFLGSLYTLCGAILLVFALRGDWHIGFSIFGGFLIAFGLAVAAFGFWVHGRLQTTLLVDREGVTLVNRRRKRSLAWADIDEVALGKARLSFIRHDARRRQVVIFDPRQVSRPLFDDMVATMQQRLDDSRGYGRPGPI